jgi:hypothetical protein
MQIKITMGIKPYLLPILSANNPTNGINMIPGAEYAAITQPIFSVDMFSASRAAGRAGATIGNPNKDVKVREITMKVFLL